MSTGMLHLHSFLPYIFLAMLAFTFVSALLGWQQKKAMSAMQFKLSKITFILGHVQLTVGIVLLFVSDRVQAALESGELMSNAANRKLVVEHPMAMVIGIALLTMGYIKAKKQTDLVARNKKVAVFYGIALLIFLGMIPWGQWFN